MDDTLIFDLRFSSVSSGSTFREGMAGRSRGEARSRDAIDSNTAPGNGWLEDHFPS